jgi:hypothetical protein
MDLQVVQDNHLMPPLQDLTVHHRDLMVHRDLEDQDLMDLDAFLMDHHLDLVDLKHQRVGAHQEVLCI